MPTIEANSPFAEQAIITRGVVLGSVGEFFQHYQHQLHPREEAVLGFRCIGYSYRQIAALIREPVGIVKQWERRGLAHMVALYSQGK